MSVLPQVGSEETELERIHLQIVAGSQGVEVAVVPVFGTGGELFIAAQPGHIEVVGVKLHPHDGFRPEEGVHRVGEQTELEAGLAWHSRDLEVGVEPAGLDVDAVAGEVAAPGPGAAADSGSVAESQG